MIFRWSLWGADKAQSLLLLRDSILSFRHFFGNVHDYIVCTDDVDFLSRELGDLVVLVDFKVESSPFALAALPTWKKWCPGPRLNIAETEIYIDSDVFLLRYPTEIDLLLTDPAIRFAILDEYFGQPWQHGAMAVKATAATPFVNAGFFLQKAGADITPSLIKELDWWQANIAVEDHRHHDEQGALAIALTEPLQRGELYILPKSKYLLIGENENTHLDTLDGVTLLHAVYPHHPAYYRFQQTIRAVYQPIK